MVMSGWALVVQGVGWAMDVLLQRMVVSAATCMFRLWSLIVAWQCMGWAVMMMSSCTMAAQWEELVMFITFYCLDGLY